MEEESIDGWGQYPILNLAVAVALESLIKEDGYQYTLKRGDYLILSSGKFHKGYRPCMEETHFNWLHFSTIGKFQYESTTKSQTTRSTGGLTQPCKGMLLATP
ncbi:hypothetical protein MUB24_22820 [Lederbergia sp. NSJ-179]|uniref:hypothetical protein n=1 Tax=Lederbergia sp. NSJ-179 TaxID=2931402 RepID=UPI001FD019CD|nr:hypothetical protein [Lederbergia sp. NSJ-179]MCJ7843646.1 hypothetical protein [Lederbergia sp. NSJ-179]